MDEASRLRRRADALAHVAALIQAGFDEDVIVQARAAAEKSQILFQRYEPTEGGLMADGCAMRSSETGSWVHWDTVVKVFGGKPHAE